MVAEFLAPSHLGSMAAHSMPWNRRAQAAVPEPVAAARPVPEAPELHWRHDPRLLRAGVQWVLYRADEVELLGTASVVLGLPLTAVVLVVTLWVVARMHRHRTPGPPEADTAA